MWRAVVLSAGSATARAPRDGGDILKWLLPRRSCIGSVTFRHFTHGQRYDLGCHYLPLFSTASGLLAGAPLRALRFEDCDVSPLVLPQLRLLGSALTALSLHSVADAANSLAPLNLLFKVPPCRALLTSCLAM